MALALFASSEGKADASVLETGGSNLVAVDVHLEQLHLPGNWKKNDVFRTPACQLQTIQPEIERQLKLMRKARQEKLGLVLWFTNSTMDEDCTGFLLNSAGGHLTPKVTGNLRQLIKVAAGLGFNEIQVRFAPMGRNWPTQWTTWKEDLFAENWSVIESTVSALSDTGEPRIIYDLGVELGGLKAPGCSQCETYVKRIWAKFNATFPQRESYGFSVAIAPGRVLALIQNLREAGAMPTEIAIDTYDPQRPGIKIAKEEMQSAQVDLPILIQETLYNSPAMNKALREQAQLYHVRIRAIMQWPLTQGAKGQISESSTPLYPYLP